MSWRVGNIVALLPAVSLAARSVQAETDAASLARMHDIVVPPPVPPWWPLAPGWYLLAGLVTGIAAWGLWRLWQRRQAHRYRLEALAELRAIRRQAVDPREAVVGIMILLKRTALAAYPRTRVARLSGAAWWEFLDQSAGKTRFGDELGPLAEQLVYGQRAGEEVSARAVGRLYKAAEHWIRRHGSAESLSALQRAQGRGAASATSPVSG